MNPRPPTNRLGTWRTYWVVASTLLALLPTLSFPALASGYSDISGEQAIEASALAQRNVLPPVWGSQLAPYAPVYRYEEAWMLAALLDPRDQPFTVIAWPDVPPGYWALQAVNQVVGVGIMHDENGRFNGDRKISQGEFVEALDEVLRYRAIPPPPPRGGDLVFRGLTGKLAQAVDRAANRWQFVRRSDHFSAYSALTRGEAVAMLARAAPLVDPSFAELLTPPATPAPTPTAPPAFFSPGGQTTSDATPTPQTAPGATPAPAATIAEQSPASASTSPTDDWTPPPIAWSWQVDPVLVTLGMADSTILAANPAYGLPGGADLDLTGVTGPLQATIRAGTHLLLAGGSGLYQVFGSGEGLWMSELAPGAQVGLGGGIVLNSQSVAGSSVQSNAGRTFFGIGPAGLLSYDLGYATLDLGVQLQAGGISSTTGGGGFGLGYQVQAHGPIGIGSLELEGGLRGQLVDPSSGAYDFVSGLVAGVGGNF